MSRVRPLPVTIVSGYLGAGKTTLVNRLLATADGRRLAILVNDFGDIAIDEELIVNRAGETIALANGCICCSIGGDLYDAIDRILTSTAPPDHLVIETSGVADPARIRQIAVAEPELDPFGIVTLVDTANLRTAMSDPTLADTVRRQIEAATLILLTKADDGSEAQVAEAAALAFELSPDAPILIGGRDALPVELILAKPDEAGAIRPAKTVVHEHCGHGHAEIYRSWTYCGPAVLSRETLLGFAGSPDLGIYRLKGFVNLPSGEMVEVHRVGDRIVIADQAVASGETRLVAIGPSRGFSPETVGRRWLECAGPRPGR